MQVPTPPLPPTPMGGLPGEIVMLRLVDQIVPLIGIMVVVTGVLIAYWIRTRSRRLPAADMAPALKPVEDRLGRLEQAVEAIGVEVERIAEGQRFVTKMLADRPREKAQLRAGE
jgi:hypothetical protein